MPREWDDDEVRGEIGDAVRIVREDRFEKFLRDRLGQSSGGPGGDKDKDNSPPRKDGDQDPSKDKETGAKKKRSLFWGDALEEGDN